MKGLGEHNNIQQSETQLTHSDPYVQNKQMLTLINLSALVQVRKWENLHTVKDELQGTFM